MITEINTPDQLKQRPDIIERLNRLAMESEEALDTNLKRGGARLKTRLSREQTWQVTESFIDSMADGKTTILVAEEGGKPQALIGFIKNREDIAERLGIENNYIMFFKALTERECRGTGIFKELLAYAMKDQQDPLVIGCVSNKKAITDEGVEFDHVMNLDMYASMMLKLYPDSKIQVRSQSPMGRQYGHEKFDLKDFIENRTVNQSAVQRIINERDDDKRQIGFYVHSK